MTQGVGVYVSVPFCRAKCTFCNFASGAFPPERMSAYVDRLVGEIAGARAWAVARGLVLPEGADSVFLGGGTPSLLSASQMREVLGAVRSSFVVSEDAEVTVEAAPGQIAEELLEAMLRGGVNRVSLGVQSFVDAESRAVGRLHTAAACLAEIARLRNAGVRNLNVDLIAGLPHQTVASWGRSLEAVVEAGVEHVSVYMLEVDGDSRLGREVTAVRAESQMAVLGQAAGRYGAATVPDGDACAGLYEAACGRLEAAGLEQYEISNFGREGFQSRHNRKYWERAAYVGFGLDAHSMLCGEDGGAVRFARTDALEGYLGGSEEIELEGVGSLEAFEEAVFLGLRLREGVSVRALRASHGGLVEGFVERARALVGAGVVEVAGDWVRLTGRGRAVSSMVFGELLAVVAV